MSTRGDIIRGAGGHLKRNNDLGVGMGHPHGGDEGDIRVQMVDGSPKLYAKAGGQWYGINLQASTSAGGVGDEFILGGTADHIKITPESGLEVINNYANVSSLGKTLRIGKIADDTSRLEVDSSGNLAIMNRQGTTDTSLVSINADGSASLAGTVSIGAIAGAGVNLVPVQYVIFPGDTLPETTVTRGAVALDSTSLIGGAGNNIRLTATGTDAYAYLSSANDNYNITISPNKKWIYSFYVKSTTDALSIQGFLKSSAGSHYSFSATTHASAGTITRVSGVMDLSSDASTTCNIRIDNNVNTAVAYYSGIMLEEQIGTGTEPSVLHIPGDTNAGLQYGTTITGGGMILNGGGVIKTINKDTSTDTTAGFFLGKEGDYYTFGIGDSTNSLVYNGNGALSITGAITSTSGTVGGWTLAASSLYNGRTAIADTNSGVFIGQTGISLGGAGAPTISLTAAGVATIDEIVLTGNINTEGGTANIMIGTDNADGGRYNIGIGIGALEDATSHLDTSNIAIGNGAGGSIHTAAGGNPSSNLCLGNNAGDTIRSGDSNIAIGNGADCTSGDSGQIAIGTGVATDAGQQARIGDSGEWMEFDFSGGGGTTTWTSDARVKKDISDTDLGLDFINKLRPVKYIAKNMFDYPDVFEVNKDGKRPSDPTKVQDGLIAHEVKAVMDELDVTFSGWALNKDTRQRLDFTRFTIPLIKAIQELSAKVTALEAQIN